MDKSFYEREADGNRYFSVMKTKNNRTPAHFHNATEIIAVTEGEERVVINGCERVLHVGELGVSNSFDVHYYDCPKKSSVTVVMLSEEYMAHFRETFGGNPPNFFPKSEYSERMLALIEKLYALQSENRLIVSGYVDVLLGTMFEAYPSVQKADNGGSRIGEILRYLDDNYSKNLTLASVSAQFGYSTNYFSALFNRFTGMHFRDYLNRLRVARADALLRSGAKVGEVLASCGFESANTYYRARKRWENRNF